MTDQTESEHAPWDSAEFLTDPEAVRAYVEEMQTAIRALEAEVRELKAEEDHEELEFRPPPSRIIKLVPLEKHEELRADRDRLTAELAAAREALERIAVGSEDGWANDEARNALDAARRAGDTSEAGSIRQSRKGEL